MQRSGWPEPVLPDLPDLLFAVRVGHLIHSHSSAFQAHPDLCSELDMFGLHALCNKSLACERLHLWIEPLKASFHLSFDPSRGLCGGQHLGPTWVGGATQMFQIQTSACFTDAEGRCGRKKEYFDAWCAES